MIRLGEKIKINDKQELIIFNDGLMLKELSTSGNFYLNDRKYLYKDMQEKLEVRVIESYNYNKVYYYDENGNKTFLSNEEKFKDRIFINIQIEVEKNNKKSVDYIDLYIENLELALELVKKANKYIKKVLGNE